jgi:multimeric flavodoxin WrbA
MKIVAINGSPKGRGSNTNIMIEVLLRGLKSPTSEIFNIYLSEKTIKYCTGCYSCWFKTPGICVIKDDMKELISLIDNTDILIFGTPLYFNNISGTLKVFFDRLTAMGGDPHKKTNKQHSVVVPHFIMMSNCGYPYRSQFDVISLWINNISKMLQSKLIGEFYTIEGKILTRPTDEQKKSRTNYLTYLENCGKEYLLNLELKEDQKALLKKSIIDF